MPKCILNCILASHGIGRGLISEVTSQTHILTKAGVHLSLLEIYMCVCVCVCVCVCIPVPVKTNVYICIYIDKYIYIYKDKYIYIQTDPSGKVFTEENWFSFSLHIGTIFDGNVIYTE